MRKNEKKAWVPEIFYEENTDGLTGAIPFISVPKNEEMPKMLFIFESRETGEIEPGSRGEDVPVTEITLHQYANMDALKRTLNPDEYDRVRLCLGLKPLKEATQLGSQITQGLRESLG